MRTRTIYNAMGGAYRTIIFSLSVDDFLHRKARQWAIFERELLRRMDHYDWYEARQRFFDAPHNLNGKEQNDMNEAYSRFMRNPKEQARLAAWRKENSV